MAKEKLGRKGKIKETEESRDTWEGQEISVESDTKLEDDHGTGGAVIVRCFEFKANPEAFKTIKPTKEMLLSDHKKGIELFLWKDDLIAIPHLSPKVIISKKKDGYRIFVACVAKLGSVIIDKPKTLTQITNGPSQKNSN